MKPARLIVLLVPLLIATVALAGDKWVTLDNCRLIRNPANDGDSFHVRAAGREYIFRLYFVDAPETDLSFPGRVAEQAKYFGITVQQALQIGAEAERFAHSALSHPFRIRTCYQDAGGRSRLPRYFGFVTADAEDLSETLVAHGLARVYGAAAAPSDHESSGEEWQRLRRLERQAKAARLGGWSLAAGNAGRHDPSSRPSLTRDSFDSFFHPQNSSPAGTVDLSGEGVKLDINTASEGSLEELPGIGPVLAKRIILARPFKSADDLQRVKGIGPRRYAELRPYFE